MYKFISNSENETIDFARQISKHAKNWWYYCFIWWFRFSVKQNLLGGVLQYFDIANEISSPTFTIVNEHNTKDNIPIYHFDVYRLEDVDEFYAIGGDEYFEKGICIIEWGEIIESILPNDYLKISFTRNFENENMRILTLEPHGERFNKLVERIVI